MKREDIYALLVNMPAHPTVDRIQDAFETLLADIAAGQLAIERMRVLEELLRCAHQILEWIEPALPRPSIKLASSPRNVDVYWHTSDESIDEIRLLKRALADAILEAERGAE